nr:DUF1513 domain-containing protein [Vibrio gangliei]
METNLEHWQRTRRNLLKTALYGGTCWPLLKLESAIAQAVDNSTNIRQPRLIGNSLSPNGQFYTVVADWQGHPIHSVLLPERAHGIAISDPKMNSNTEAVAFGRRPGTFMQVFDYQTGAIRHLVSASEHRHFYGHGVFSADGQYLLATEGIRQTSEGVIGIYDVNQDYKKVEEWRGFGIGPHEIIRLNDGSYAVGVGGVHTDGRTAKNLDSMKPSLARLSQTGEILSQARLPDHKLSIRHLGYNQDDIILCGQQYRGEPSDYPSLIAMQKEHGKLIELHAEPEQWARFNHYIASIAVIEDYVLATSPPGNCYGIWSLSQNKLLELKPLPSASGVISNNEQFYVSSGAGEVIVRSPQGNIKKSNSQIYWDNHWNLIPA